MVPQPVAQLDADVPVDYADALTAIKADIRTTEVRAGAAANREPIALYWASAEPSSFGERRRAGGVASSTGSPPTPGYHQDAERKAGAGRTSLTSTCFGS